MRAEIINVGTEILLGEIVNTNAAFLGQKLAENGISVFRQQVVGDNHRRLAEALKNAIDANDIVICTGGLGPTQDDMTKEALAQVCNLPMEQSEEALSWLQENFRGREMTENNFRQALFPKSSIPLYNTRGSAPGCRLDYQGKYIFLLPGPPREMQPMFDAYVLPLLKELSDEVFQSINIKLIGIGESSAEDMVSDLISSQYNPTIGTYASLGEVHFRLTANAPTAEEAQSLLKPLVKEFQKRFGDLIYGYDDDNIVVSVMRLLKERNWEIAIAESCTGGMVAADFVNEPGASEMFGEGIIAYSNAAKVRRLGVSEKTLAAFGAVSAETALEMARGVAKVTGADIGLSTTGVAGPGGGTVEKPVGLVYTAVCHGDDCVVEEHYFSGSRTDIRRRTTMRLWAQLRKFLLSLSY